MTKSLLNIIIDGVKSSETAGIPMVIEEFVQLAKDAERFDFGELMLECTKNEDGKNVYDVPSLTEEEMGFWFEGLIPLPADSVWYEFNLKGLGS